MNWHSLMLLSRRARHNWRPRKEQTGIIRSLRYFKEGRNLQKLKRPSPHWGLSCLFSKKSKRLQRSLSFRPVESSYIIRATKLSEQNGTNKKTFLYETGSNETHWIHSFLVNWTIQEKDPFRGRCTVIHVIRWPNEEIFKRARVSRNCVSLNS